MARIPAFLLNRRHDVVSMLKALARGDFETVERLGHGMKGSGASFGFQAITDIGTELEVEAGVGNDAAARHWVEQLTVFLDRIGTGPEFLVRPAVALAQAIATIAPVGAGGRRLVLIEDNEDLRGLMADVLEAAGHHVAQADDGLAGLALSLADKPDIAIIDIGLPGIDGHEVARRVRAALGNSIVLVALTARSGDADRVAALAAGFDAHVAKPLAPGALAGILETKQRRS